MFSVTKGVLKNFTKVAGKHLFLLKRDLTQLFPCEFCEIFTSTFFYRKHIFHITPPVAASEVWCSISLTHFVGNKAKG